MYYTVVGIVIASVILYLVHVCSLLLSPQRGWTPLYTASLSEHTDVVRVLLENKADPNISDKVSCSVKLVANGHHFTLWTID